MVSLFVGTEDSYPLDLAPHVAVQTRLLDKHLRESFTSPSAELDVGGGLVRK